MNYGKVEKMLRGKAGYRVILKDIERLTGISKSSLSYYRKNPHAIPLRVAVEVANAIGMRPEDWEDLRHE